MRHQTYDNIMSVLGHAVVLRNPEQFHLHHYREQPLRTMERCHPDFGLFRQVVGSRCMGAWKSSKSIVTVYYGSGTGEIQVFEGRIELFSGDHSRPTLSNLHDWLESVYGITAQFPVWLMEKTRLNRAASAA